MVGSSRRGAIDGASNVATPTARRQWPPGRPRRATTLGLCVRAACGIRSSPTAARGSCRAGCVAWIGRSIGASTRRPRGTRTTGRTAASATRPTAGCSGTRSRRRWCCSATAVRRSAGIGSMVVASVVSDVVVKRFFDGRRPLFERGAGRPGACARTRRRRRSRRDTRPARRGSRPASRWSRAGRGSSSPRSRPPSRTRACTSAPTGSRTSSAASRSARGRAARPDARAGAQSRMRRPSRGRAGGRADRAAPLAEARGADRDEQGAGTAVIRLDPRPRSPSACRRRSARLEPDETMDDVVREIMAGDDAPRCSACTAATARSRAWRTWRSSSTCRSCRCRAAPSTTSPARRESKRRPRDRRSAGRIGGRRQRRRADRRRRTTTVLNAASIGIYPEFVAERTKRKARLGKWIGGVAATWRGLRDAEPIDIVIRGRRARVWSVFASVGRNTPGQVATFQRRTLSDDVLDVRVLHARGRGCRRSPRCRSEPRRARSARAATAAAGIRHRAHHRDRDRDLGAPAVGRSDVLRARRRADAATGGRRGRALHADVPDRAEGAARLRSRSVAPAGRAESTTR